MTLEQARRLDLLSRQLSENLMSAAFCAKEIGEIARAQLDVDNCAKPGANGDGRKHGEPRRMHRPLLDESTLSVIWKNKTLHLGHTRSFWLLARLARRPGQYVTGWRGGDHALRSAAQRIFGSWRNALLAAGIAPLEMARAKRWSPTKILVVIRQLARRQRPLTCEQMERRYRNIVTAARRHFGSWNKAVLTAGVDPSKLRRVPPWTPDRIIEAILTRALRNESLSARQVEPQSLTAAGKRFFGSWPAAVAAAGLDPALTARKPILNAPPRTGEIRARRRTRSGADGGVRRWNKNCIVAELHRRLQDHKPLNSTALASEDPRLYDAMRRHCGSWQEAIRAAGLDPETHIVTPEARGSARSRQAALISQVAASLRPETTQ